MTIDLDAIEARANTPIECDRCNRVATHELMLCEGVYLLCSHHAEDETGSAPLMDGQTQDRADRLALVARVRELEGEVTALRALCTRRDAACSDAIDMLMVANAANAELRATLANERGEGEGPSEGWTWDGNSCAWLYGLDVNGEYPDDGWTVEQTPAGQDLGWTWEHCGTRSDPYPYARDAMRAADIARAGGAT